MSNFSNSKWASSRTPGKLLPILMFVLIFFACAWMEGYVKHHAQGLDFLLLILLIPFAHVAEFISVVLSLVCLIEYVFFPEDVL